MVHPSAGGEPSGRPPRWRQVLTRPVLIIAAVAMAAASVTLAVAGAEGSIDDGWSRTLSVLAALAAGAALFAALAVRAPGLALHRPYLRSAAAVAAQLLHESTAMAQYALQQGLPVRPAHLQTLHDLSGEVLEDVGGAQLDRLARTHAALAATVHPARPDTIALLAGEQREGRDHSWLGQVRLVRMMMGLSVGLLTAFVILATIVGTQVDSAQALLAGDISIGQKLANVGYLVVAAALGAAFAALSKAFRYIADRSWDARYESSYWIRFVQGVTAGLVLAILLAGPLFGASGESATTFRLTLPLLAFVGGFSEDLVLRILHKIIEAIATLAKGSVEERVEAERARAEAEAALRSVADRQVVLTELLALQASLKDTPGADEVAELIKRWVDSGSLVTAS